MNYINSFKEMNISFNNIDEKSAIDIMQHQYSYSKLISFSCVFEKYNQDPSRLGKFVSLDFFQLYALAEIDSFLSKLVMIMCLDIERIIKSTIAFDANNVDSIDSFFSDYLKQDNSFLQKTYCSDNISIIKNEYNDKSIEEIGFYGFIDIIQFGTLLRVVNSFYNTFVFDGSLIPPLQKCFESIKTIRNLVAHNHSLLNKLNIRSHYRVNKVSSYLGKKGIKHKTLSTNMSIGIIHDLCCLFYTVHFLSIETEYYKKMFGYLDSYYCQKYSVLFQNNDSLKSNYYYIKKVLNVFFDC